MNIAPKWLDWTKIDDYNKISYTNQYTYGIKDIQIEAKEFNNASVYITKPIVLQGNIVEVGLEAEANNIIAQRVHANTNRYDTAIEYYISFKEFPNIEHWYPILPAGETYVYNEMLFKDLPLRFIVDLNSEIKVYRNNVLLNGGWTLNNNKISITNLDPHAKYTVSYNIDLTAQDPNHVTVPSIDKNIIPYYSSDGAGQKFTNGTNHNGIVLLDKFPYINYQAINDGDSTYTPIEVILDNHTFAGVSEETINANTTPSTTNITDYTNLTEPTIVPFDIDTHPTFEYIQNGNQIQFGETFKKTNVVDNENINHGDADICVKYNYLNVTIRCKIILRRTSILNKASTPSVESYNLIIKEIR